MAFEQKEWLDRVSEFPMRRQLTDEDGNVELVTLERADGEVSTEGDAFSASNMNDLEQRVADAFGSIDLTATAISYNDSSTSLGASNVQGAIEKLKKFASDGKSKIASAITNKGVSTSADATFATMATNIGNIPNRNSGTYTPSSNGSALDMGYNNTYRYVNTNTVYDKGKSDASASYNGVSPSVGQSDFYTNNFPGSEYGRTRIIMGTPSVSKSGKTITVKIPETVRVIARTIDSSYVDTGRTITVTIKLS